MNDHIKREDAINDIEQMWDWETVDDIQTSTALRQVISDIRNIPSADVVERKRGEWTYNLEQGDPISIECPLCGATIYISGDIPDDENYLIVEDYHYCPNCGAMMKGSENENGE